MSSQSASTHFGGGQPHHHVTGAALNQFWSWIIGAKQAALIVIKGWSWLSATKSPLIFLMSVKNMVLRGFGCISMNKYAKCQWYLKSSPVLGFWGGCFIHGYVVIPCVGPTKPRFWLEQHLDVAWNKLAISLFTGGAQKATPGPPGKTPRSALTVFLFGRHASQHCCTAPVAGRHGKTLIGRIDTFPPQKMKMLSREKGEPFSIRKVILGESEVPG